ncbi:DUF4062 domain-containing protein [Bowmanella denitrificans]|uniref:DUF4062 domain-containing protein n=1 Tax=Bowmanella denitrificans TaxID=366582 RepID=UPI000C9CD33C|nr:DUF4062 domain-containing protein [Bowmanella denitrificans]
MDKRYQVFVSSTYTDLLEERAEVMQALLELDCMPSGMELFPAANEEQWEWIKKVIDESDYYLVILAGRYGSISKKTGFSYTEMEYRYAIETGKPVIGFLHERPEKIEKGKSESDPDACQKLEDFRDLVSSKLCKYWNSPSDLGAKVSRSITQLIKHQPAVGWIKANSVTESTSKELLDLRKKNEVLEEKLKKARIERPSGTEELAQGQDIFTLEFVFEAKKVSVGKNNKKYWKKGEIIDCAVDLSWDRIFSFVGPNMITASSEGWMISYLNGLIERTVKDDLEEAYPDNKIDDIKIRLTTFQTIKIQFRALNLITHEGNDSNWVLTPYGENYLTNLLAVKKHNKSSKRDAVTGAPS